MEAFSIRWMNFRSLRDTEWLRVRPITIVIGSNASGKTSIHAPLLLMKQTLDSPDRRLALKTKGDLFDAGSYRDLIHRHDQANNLTLALRHEHYQGEAGRNDLKELGLDPPGELSLEFGIPKGSLEPSLLRYRVFDIFGRSLIHRYRIKSGKYSLREPSREEFSDEFRTVVLRALPEHVPCQSL